MAVNFSSLSEVDFRQLEKEHLRRVSTTPHAVIALGGGAYVDSENRRIVDETGVAVWLDASFSGIRERVRHDGTRPLLENAEQAQRLYAERLPAYKLARIHVLTDNRLPDEIAEEIVQRVITP